MSDTAFLEGLNDAVQSLEASLDPGETGAGHPIVFIVGPPRSGTTLLSQVLVAGTNIGYIDNLSARFWDAPATGFALSQEVLGDARQTLFQSTFGRTDMPSDPHEFGRFWREHLGYEDMRQRPPEHERTIDWASLRRTLRRLLTRADRPFMFKLMLGIWHLEAIAREVPEAIFVRVQRDSLDVAASLLKMRKRRHGSIVHWTSLVPMGAERIEHPFDQVAFQVRAIERTIAHGLQNITPNRIVPVDYVDLCQDPDGALDRIQGAIPSSALIRRLPLPREGFTPSSARSRLSDDESKRLEEAFSRLGHEFS